MERLHISFSEILSSKTGEIHYIQNKKANRSSAINVEESFELRISVPRTLGASSVKINIYDEKCENLIKTLYAENLCCSDAFDTYQISIRGNSFDVGLYFYNIVVSAIPGDVFANGTPEHIWFSEKHAGYFQLTFYQPSRQTPTSILGGVIYHIFVDRFAKDVNVKPKAGAVIADNWDIIPEYPEYPGAFMRNNTFYGGSLNSAAERLDYIKSLGVNIIYLSPVFDSPSNHKYDTADYLTVDSMFGGDSALESFINAAKARGISVILDGVFNHTGADSIYFNRFGNYPELGAYQSKDSKYYGWYHFKSHPKEYESWWGIDILPRINTGNCDFENFVLNKVIKKYRDMGIAGLRLDVVDELSDSFVEKIKSALSKDGESLLYGEVWEDGSNKIAYGERKKYYLGKELDGVMNYPLRAGLIDFFRNKNTEKLKYALTDIINNAPKPIRDMQMNILGTHDTERILTAIGAESSAGKSNSELAVMRMTEKELSTAAEKLISAYTVLATLPGIPAIFYGDEAGLEGYSDPFNRMPYPKNINKKILNHYKKIGQIRNKHNVYSDGEYELIELNKELLAFSRHNDKGYYITVSNNSEEEIELTFSKTAKELISGKAATEHKLAKNSSAVYMTASEEFTVNTK